MCLLTSLVFMHKMKKFNAHDPMCIKSRVDYIPIGAPNKTDKSAIFFFLSFFFFYKFIWIKNLVALIGKENLESKFVG